MSSQRYFSRDLSWLEFNARVLDQAMNTHLPLLERLKFLGIVSTNFDEFFMVRIAAIKAAIRAREAAPEAGGMTATELLAAAIRRIRGLVDAKYACLLNDILPELSKHGLGLVKPQAWTPRERRLIERFFDEQVYPLLTPLRVDGDRFPSTGNLRIHAAFLLAPLEKESETGEKSGSGRIAIVQVPSNLDRFVRLDTGEATDETRFALLEEIIQNSGNRLFPGQEVLGSIVFRVTRDADFPVNEERDTDFLSALEDVLSGRQNSIPVRLSFSGRCPELETGLREGLGLGEEETYRLAGPVDLRGLSEWAQRDGLLPGAEKLKDKPWSPVKIPEPETPAAFWEALTLKDRILHLPYESFDPILQFIDSAADDPDVLAIKMTLYRTSGDSPIIKALARAARARKQVCVLVELKARFDEEQNIAWASRLEQAGAIVVYGIVGLKVHAKAALVIRREQDGAIGRYLHLSTGNYNERTARLYADICLMTANAELCADVSRFFNAITGYSSVQRLPRLAVAPFDLKERLLTMIERESQRSTPESPGLIMAKMNSLADREVVDALYRASQAGVHVRLNIRGVCTLIPGLKGLSENIEVTSLLGRYLEHARILYFQNGGSQELYLSSADWMPRNLERRVELMFPILDPEAIRRVKGILEDSLRDSTLSYRLLTTGRWQKIHPPKGAQPFHAQATFHERARRIKELADAPPEDLIVRRFQQKMK